MIILLAVPVPLAVAGAVLFAYGVSLAFRHGLGGSPADPRAPTPKYGFSVQYRPGGPGQRSMSRSRSMRGYSGRLAALSLRLALSGWGAAGRCWAQGASRGGNAREPWTAATTFWVVSLAVLSIMAVVALVPYAAEYRSPSESMAEHRRRLKGLGAPGRLTEMLLPHSVDGWEPQRFWGRILCVCWGAIIALFAWLVLTSAPGQRLHNLLLLPVFAIGLPAVCALILRFGRGVTRLSQAAAQANRRSPPSPGRAAEDTAADKERPDGG